jgi:NADPH:quinone reductase-like Zn-dependent oxidoreductase
MKAVVFRQHGGPEVLELVDMPTPEPGPGRVQVRVTAVALNHIDLWMRRGLPSMKIALPHIPGGDVCGVVSAVGAGVAGVPVGLRVVVNPGLTCGRCPFCLGGRDNLCPDFRMLGEHVFGGMAEFVTVPAPNIVPVPADRVPLSDAELAAVPITFITAWHMLVTRAAVAPGETVLVLGAGSGVGVAAIQIAKLFGARVIAAASTAAKLTAARALGADETIDYVRDDLVAEMKRLTDRRGADIVFEHTGAATFPKSVVVAARGGRIVLCGATDGYQPPLNLRHVFWRHLSVLGSTLAPKATLFTVIDRLAARQLRPVVHQVLPLAEVAAGHTALEARTAFGKIVLTVG